MERQTAQSITQGLPTVQSVVTENKFGTGTTNRVRPRHQSPFKRPEQEVKNQPMPSALKSIIKKSSPKSNSSSSKTNVNGVSATPATVSSPAISATTNSSLTYKSLTSNTRTTNIKHTEPLKDEPEVPYQVKRRSRAVERPGNERQEKARSLGTVNAEDLNREFKVSDTSASHMSLGLSLKDRQAMLKESFTRDQSPNPRAMSTSTERPKTPSRLMQKIEKMDTGMGWQRLVPKTHVWGTLC